LKTYRFKLPYLKIYHSTYSFFLPGFPVKFLLALAGTILGRFMTRMKFFLAKQTPFIVKPLQFNHPGLFKRFDSFHGPAGGFLFQNIVYIFRCAFFSYDLDQVPIFIEDFALVTHKN